MHKRLLSGIMIALLSVCILLSPWYVQLGSGLLLMLMMLYELANMHSHAWSKALVLPLGCLLLAIISYNPYLIELMILAGVLVRLVLMLRDQKVLQVFWGLAILDIAMFGYCLLLMMQTTWLLATTVTLIAGIDVFGYYIGKHFGATRIIVWVSPNKTLEGYMGGMLWLLLVGTILVIWVDVPLQLLAYHFMILYMLAILGDLFMSFLKRQVHVKDTGSLIPGHGGVLDRVDSWLLVVPWVYLFYAMGN
jgi:phosphatidate cytidylyltransferase